VGLDPIGRRQTMSKIGKFVKPEKNQPKVRPHKSVSMRGRDILRFEEHFRIAPKHPGMGRR
jgi:hypothetical protein